MKISKQNQLNLFAILSLLILAFLYADSNFLPERYSEEQVLEKWYDKKVSLHFNRNRTNYFIKTDKNTYDISSETYYSFRTDDYVVIIKSYVVGSLLALALPEKLIRFNEGIYVKNNGGNRLLLINAMLVVGLFIFKKWLTLESGRKRLVIFFSTFAILQLLIYLFR